MLRCSSGSSTGRRASMTAAFGDGHDRASCASAGAGSGISPTPIGRIPAVDVAAHSARPTSRPRSPPSPRPSATRPAADIYLFAHEHEPTASPPPRWPSASSCTPTWPATTSTSWPPAATSRSPSARRRRRRRRPPVEALPGHRAEQVDLEMPVRHDDLARHAARPGALALLPPRRRPRRWPRRSASSTAGPWPPPMGDARRPASARSAPRCTPWPTPSPPTASPPTPRSATASCASCPSTARSATPPSSTR